MERKPFPTRFSQAELARLRVEARSVGWPVGKLIRFRALRGDIQQEQRIAVVEKMAKDASQD